MIFMWDHLIPIGSRLSGNSLSGTTGCVVAIMWNVITKLFTVNLESSDSQISTEKVGDFGNLLEKTFTILLKYADTRVRKILTYY